MTQPNPVLNRYDRKEPIRADAPLLDTAWALNASLDRDYAFGLLNESRLASTQEAADSELEGRSMLSCLLSARVLEGALLTAGIAVDQADFRTAGDLLINPREMRIHYPDGSWTIKHRHARISDCLFESPFIPTVPVEQLRRRIVLETVMQPLMPALFERLRGSPWITSEYLKTTEGRMEQIGKTMSFLQAWGVAEPAALDKFLRTAASEQRRLLENNLCRFQADLFLALGDCLRRICSHPDPTCRSEPSISNHAGRSATM